MEHVPSSSKQVVTGFSVLDTSHCLLLLVIIQFVYPFPHKLEMENTMDLVQVLENSYFPLLPVQDRVMGLILDERNLEYFTFFDFLCLFSPLNKRCLTFKV